TSSRGAWKSSGIQRMSAPLPQIPNDQLPVPPAIITAWPRCVQWAAAALLGVATVLLIALNFAHLRQGLFSPNLLHVESVPYQIDVNTADKAELLQLPAIGETLAQRILEYRQEHGGFRSVDDLRRVKGIGPITLEKLRSHVCVSEPEESPEENTGSA